MKEIPGQRDLDDLNKLDAGVPAREILRQRVARAERERDQALAELSGEHSDEEILDAFGLDMTELRRSPDLDDIDWSLP